MVFLAAILLQALSSFYIWGEYRLSVPTPILSSCRYIRTRPTFAVLEEIARTADLANAGHCQFAVWLFLHSSVPFHKLSITHSPLTVESNMNPYLHIAKLLSEPYNFVSVLLEAEQSPSVQLNFPVGVGFVPILIQ